MKVDEALQGVSRLAFDTAPIIYFVEANPGYDKLVSSVFNRVAAASQSVGLPLNAASVMRRHTECFTNK